MQYLTLYAHTCIYEIVSLTSTCLKFTFLIFHVWYPSLLLSYQLNKLMKRVARERGVRPLSVGGAEQCYAPFAHESRINVVFLREPRCGS